MRYPTLFVVLAGLLPAFAVQAAAGPPRGAAARGLAFAEQRCAACHAVRPNGTSPNPEAPPWDDIANRPGTTAATLRGFLRDSHNYPAAMRFTVDRARIRELAAWMITLRRDGYQPSE